MEQKQSESNKKVVQDTPEGDNSLLSASLPSGHPAEHRGCQTGKRRMPIFGHFLLSLSGCGNLPEHAAMGEKQSESNGKVSKGSLEGTVNRLSAFLLWPPHWARRLPGWLADNSPLIRTLPPGSMHEWVRTSLNVLLWRNSSLTAMGRCQMKSSRETTTSLAPPCPLTTPLDTQTARFVSQHVDVLG